MSDPKVSGQTYQMRLRISDLDADLARLRALLERCRPVVSQRKLAAMCNGADDEVFRLYETLLADIDAALGKGER